MCPRTRRNRIWTKDGCKGYWQTGALISPAITSITRAESSRRKRSGWSSTHCAIVADNPGTIQRVCPARLTLLADREGAGSRTAGCPGDRIPALV